MEMWKLIPNIVYEFREHTLHALQKKKSGILMGVDRPIISSMVSVWFMVYYNHL